MQIRLNYRPAGEVFDLALRAQQQRERTNIENFVEELKEDLLDVGPINFKDKVTSMGLPDSVRRTVLNYIEEAEKS